VIKTFVSNSERETKALAALCARFVKGGETIGLIGNLGSGKTIFVKGFLRALGCKKIVTSPTFIIGKHYKISLPNKKSIVVLHIDAYRLNNSNDLLSSGFLDEIGRPNVITLVEWIDKLKRFKPDKSLLINFNVGKVDTNRIITFKTQLRMYKSLFDALDKRL